MWSLTAGGKIDEDTPKTRPKQTVWFSVKCGVVALLFAGIFLFLAERSGGIKFAMRMIRKGCRCRCAVTTISLLSFSVAISALVAV